MQYDLGDGNSLELRDDIDPAVEKMPEILEASVDSAERIATKAIADAPVDSGEYVAGIQVQKTRKGARVFASDFKSAWIEFGVPAHGIEGRFILRRAAEAAGFKFKKRR